MATSEARIAAILAGFEQRLQQVERGSTLSNASMHKAPLLVYSPDDPDVVRAIIGQQPDGTITHVDVNAPPPPVPSLPTVEEHAGTLVISWDGTFVDGVAAPADWDHVEVHISTTSGYTPDDTTEVITIHSLKGGSVTLALDPVAHYVRLQSVNTSKVESAPTAEVEGTPLNPALVGGMKTYYEDEPPMGLGADDNGSLWFDTNDGNLMYRWDGVGLEWVAVQLGPAAVTTDGDAPTLAPSNLEVIGGFGAIFTRWTPIVNPDPVEYEVHISKNANFAADYAGGGTGPEFFETFSSDLSRWPASYNGPVIITGQARLTSSAGTFMGIATGQRFTMDEKAVSAKITPAATPGATQQVIFSMVGDAQNSFQMIKSATNTSIICRIRVNGSNSDTTVAVTTGQVWWRMRESGANINFEVSSDNITWSVLRTAAHGMSVAALISMQIDISCGDTNSGSVLTPLVTNVDNVAYGSETQSKTLATVTAGSSFTIRTLPDGSPLLYGNQPYYVKVIAKDGDGYGPFSLEDTDMLRQVNTPDISAEFAYLGTLLVDQLRGGTLAADVILGAVMRTADVGQRAEMGPFGFVTYDSTGAPVIVLPSNADNVASIRADIEARGLTVTGKASLRGTQHELAQGAGLTLQSSITAPQAPPSVVVDWPQTTLPLFAAGTGENPTDNHGLFWLDSAWQICTSQLNGFKVRKFNTDGSLNSTLYEYQSASGIENTKYQSGFYISGTSTTYVLQYEIGTNKVNVQKITGGVTTTVYYNRLNTSQIPALGWDGTNLMIAEYDATNKRYRIQTMNPSTLVVSATVYTTTSVGFRGPVSGIIKGSFDLGASRYILSLEGGAATYNYVFDASGNYIAIETFPSKMPGALGISWDGTQFWTLTPTGALTKHAPAQWNDAIEPQTWFTAMNWRDADSGGTGLHETDMGPVATFQMRRRGWLTLTAATIPDDGTSDGADSVSFFVGKVNSSRTNLWRQTNPSAGVASATYSTFNFATTNPPAANNFPAGVSAWIRSASLDSFSLPALEFKGDGTGRFGGVSIEQFVYAHRARSQLNGGGLRKVDSTGISWDARLMSTATGFGANIAVDGYFDISLPANGTVITGVGGASNQTVASGAIPLPVWTALYYILPLGSGNATVAANFRLVTYTAAVTIPPHWVLVCFRSGESRSTSHIWGDGRQQDVWRAMTLAGTWAQFDASRAPMFKLENGLVRFRGTVKGQVGGTITTMAQGFRPAWPASFACKNNGAATASRVDVLTDGTVACQSDTTNANVFLALDDISFPADL